MISDMVIRDIITWIAAVLSVYRMAHMIAMEDGPFDVFSTLRGKVGQSNWIGRGFHCVLCISFWLTLPAIFVHWVIIDPILAWLSIAGACLILHKKLYLK